jgi:hypothetical protein
MRVDDVDGPTRGAFNLQGWTFMIMISASLCACADVGLVFYAWTAQPD